MAQAKFRATLEDGVTKDAKKAAASAEALHESLVGDVGKGAFLGTMFANIATAAAEMGIAVARAAGQAALSLGQAGVEALAFREKAEMGLAAITGGDGAAEFDRIKKLAGEMGTELQPTVEAIREMRQKGFGADQAAELFKQFQDMSVIGSDAKALQDEIQKIAGKGSLEAGGLEQLGEKGLPAIKVYQALAGMLGTTADEAQRLTEAGDIGGGLGIAAIQKAISGMTGGKAGALSQKFANETLGGVIQRFKSGSTLLADEIGLGMRDGLGELQPVFNDLFSMMTGDGAKSFAQGIGQAFGVIGQVIGFVWPAIKSMGDGIANQFGPGSPGELAIKVFSNALGELTGSKGSVDSLGAAFNIIGNVIGAQLVGAIGIAAVAINALRQGLEALSFIGGVVSSAFDSVRSTISNSVGSIRAAALTVGQAIPAGIRDGILGGLSSVIGAAQNVATTAITTAKQALGIASPSKVFAEMGGYMGEGMAIGLDDSASQVEGSAAGVAQGAIGAAGGTTNNLSASAGGVTVNVTIGAGAAAPGDTAAMGKAVEQAVQRALLSALGGLALEGA